MTDRILKSEQITDGLDVCTNGGPACVMIYQYNLAGALTQETYPSGRQVQHNYGTDGKLASVSSRVAKNRPFKTYAQSFSYNAAGGVTAMQLGNMRWESTAFNTRLQPTKIALGTTSGDDDMLNLEYTYGTSGASYHDNNGNVLTQTITVEDVGATPGFVATQSDTYDELNRLKSASESSTQTGGSPAQSWKQTYLFDRFGNRTFDTTSSNTTTLPENFNASIYNPTINPATNQFNAGQDYDYDPAGNVVEDATGKKFNYDGENKQTSFGTGGSLTNGGTYFYDGGGRRVKKVVGAELTVFVYDAADQLVAEYATTTPTSPELIYLTADMLGTPRVNSEANGAVAARHDYLPFGEEIANDSSRLSTLGYRGDNIRNKFDRKERDEESGLDYFEARYYHSSLGRFNSSDNFLNDTHNWDPQSWNLYAFCRNNPLNLIDPHGEAVQNTDDEKRRLSGEQMRAIEKDLQRKTGLSSLRFDADGVLTYDKNEKAQGGSEKLRQTITGAIDDKSNIFKLGDYSSSEIQFGEGDLGNTISDGKSTTNIYNIKLDFKDFKDARELSDTQASESHSIGLTVFHEIDHKVSYDPNEPIAGPPGTTRPDIGSPGSPGVIDNENIVRQQINAANPKSPPLAMRMPGAHKGQPYNGTNSRFKGTFSIEFKDASGKSKFLRWKLESQQPN